MYIIRGLYWIMMDVFNILTLGGGGVKIDNIVSGCMGHFSFQ